jgi:FtsZ-binding cell division protein ZapB
MSITQRAKDMGVEELVKENRKLKEDVVWYEKEEDRLREENKKLKEDVEFFRQCYLDLKKTM